MTGDIGYSILNLDELIQKYTGPSKKVISSKIKRLTAPGENYVGIVLKVDAILKNNNGELEDFSIVAKCVNFKTHEMMTKMIPTQYNKENSFYNEIIPCLQAFVEEMKVEFNFRDIFPTLYASRSNLNESNEEVDENAVLLFEDLGIQGFANTDRTVGFDEEDAKIVLKDLAAFHAVPIALKLKNPDVFENKIKKHLKRGFGGGSGNGPPPPPPGGKSPEDLWIEILQEYDEVKPYLKELKAKLKTTQKDFFDLDTKVPKEPFASICHTDMWTNNTMQKRVNGKIVKNKLIDFQMYYYDTVADDLIFFLWTSLQMATITNKFENLVKYYHSVFVDILGKFGCDTTPFSYDNLLIEMDDIARYTFNHILFMLIPIFGKKGQAAFDANKGPFAMKKEAISESARKRAAHLVVEFAKRNWL